LNERQFHTLKNRADGYSYFQFNAGKSMIRTPDSKHFIVNSQITIVSSQHSKWHDRFDFVGHNSELLRRSVLISIFGFEAKKIQPKAKRMVAYVNDVFFEPTIRGARECGNLFPGDAIWRCIFARPGSPRLC